jgi:hypothetical protein
MLNNHGFYPYTTFTLCNFDGGSDTDSKKISSFFKLIAVEALKEENPVIHKSTLVNLINTVQSEFTRALFPKKSSKLKLYNNQALDKVLQNVERHCHRQSQP